MCVRVGGDDSQERDSDNNTDFDEKSSHGHEDNPRVKTVEMIELGRYEIETWYYSPLPVPYQNCKVRFPDSDIYKAALWCLETVLL